jgi:cyanate permease
MLAFPVVGAVVVKDGWRTAWAGLGWALLLGLAPLAWLLVRHRPEDCGLDLESGSTSDAPLPESGRVHSLKEALATPAFWVFGVGSALYGLVASGIGLFNESILRERGFAATAYHQALAVTAVTALAGNFAGGWLASRWSLPRLLAVALLLLAGGLVSLPRLETQTGLMAQAVVMGLAGGFVTVLFFTVWPRAFGRPHLGQIQGAAQTLTVIASALGPLLLAKVVELTGSYATAFHGLAAVVFVTAGLAVMTRLPGTPSQV